MSKSEEGVGKLRVDTKDVVKADPKHVIQPAASAQKTEAEQMREHKIRMKQASDELADYMKRIRKSNEMKRLQVEELELAVDYYNAKVAYNEVKPHIDELEALEQARAEEERKKQKEAYEAMLKEKEKDKKPEIIVPKVGTPRK